MIDRPTTPRPGSETATLHAANAQFKAGRHDEAATLYAETLRINPAQVQALFFLGLIRLNAAALDEAEPLFMRCLAVSPAGPLAGFALHKLGCVKQRRGDDQAAIAFIEGAVKLKPDLAPAFNDLAVSLHRAGRHAQAAEALDRATRLDPANVMAQQNHGLVLAGLGRDTEALAAFRAALALEPQSAELWLQLGLTALKTEDAKEAETAFRRVLALDPASLDGRLHLAEALDRQHRFDEADQECQDWARRQGVVVKPCLSDKVEARVFVVGAAGLCNTATRFLFDRERFETIAVNLLASDDSDDDDLPGASPLPPCDIVFNAVSDADRGARFLDRVEGFCRKLDRPVLNPPARIAATRRDRIAALLGDIGGLVVPATRRVTRVELESLALSKEPFAVALLVRPAGSHGGHDLTRMEQPSALAAYLASMPQLDHYLTDYHDYRGADGRYRKYRFIFVDREVYPYHLAIAQDWLVHYWRANMASPESRREEANFLADYESVLGGDLVATVQAVARRLDLDYGGMDCAVTADGKLLLFEANASMLVHLDDVSEDFAYKREHVPKIAAAIGRLVARKLGR